MQGYEEIATHMLWVKMQANKIIVKEIFAFYSLVITLTLPQVYKTHCFSGPSYMLFPLPKILAPPTTIITYLTLASPTVISLT